MLNVDFQVERKKVQWNGQDVAEVRGLTPQDILKVIAENPRDADVVLSALESETKEKILDDTLSAEDIANSLQVNAKGTFSKILLQAPDLVAKVIATACDSPENWEVVKERFTLPLQFDIAQEIARLTFIDPPSFKRFVGNVLALIGAFKPDQRQTKETGSAG